MKRTTPGVISSIRQFVAGQDGPVALIELADVATGDVSLRLAQLSNGGEPLSFDPLPAGFATPDRPGTGSFGSVAAAGMAFAPVAAAARAIAAQLLFLAPDGIAEIATDGDHLFALESEPGLHNGQRQRLHRLRITGPRAEPGPAPDLAPLRLSARRSVTGLALTAGRLVVMVADPMAGFDIFTLDLAETGAAETGAAETGAAFRPLVERGAERYMLGAAVSAVAAQPGGLLVGTAALADASLRIGNWGPELLFLPDAGGWDLVIGQPRLTSDGLQVPASGLMPGLGQSANAAVKAIATAPRAGGSTTWVLVQRFAGRAVADRRAARPDLFAYRGAARLYASPDLVDWRPVPLSLPDGVGAVTALHVTRHALLIGHEAAGAGSLPLTVVPRRDASD